MAFCNFHMVVGLNCCSPTGEIYRGTRDLNHNRDRCYSHLRTIFREVFQDLGSLLGALKNMPAQPQTPRPSTPTQHEKPDC